MALFGFEVVQGETKPSIRLPPYDVYATRRVKHTLNLWVSALNPRADTSLIKLQNGSNRIAVPH